MHSKILVIDNYDSFVFNLVQYIGELGCEIDVVRNDRIDIATIDSKKYRGVVISPGPGTPTEAGISVEIIRQLGQNLPIFGVCLGHQAIGEAYGANVIRAPYPMHGKTSMISHDGTAIFRALENPFRATRYHSLIVEESSLPPELVVSARSEDGLVMGLRHEKFPIWGVQFHPESIYTTRGKDLVRNFVTMIS